MEAYTATRTNLGKWLFEWTAGPTDIFTIWLNGEQIDTVTGDEYTFGRDGYTSAPPPIEVVDDEEDAENDLYPPYAVLQWKENSSATAYIVEKYIDSAWSIRKTITNRNVGWYNYRTPVLDDQTETLYRVSCLNAKGTAGTPVAFTFQIVRNPDVPDVTYTIDVSNNLVIAGA